MPIRDPDDRFAQSDCASVGDPFTSRRPVAIASLPALRSARDPVGDERMTAVMSLYHRWRMLVHELTKFGIVGAFNTGLDFGVANLLHVGLHTNQYLAKTVSVTIAATSSYFMNRYWTFRHRARTGLGREYALFFVLNGAGLHLAGDGAAGAVRCAVVQRGAGRRPGARHAVPVHDLQALGVRGAARAWLAG